LRELREAFVAAESELLGGIHPHILPMIDISDFGGLLQRVGFALPVVDCDLVTVTYADPFALMLDLRRMGAVNILCGRNRSIMRRDVFARMAAIYRDRFAERDGRIRATFEILTATAWSPHESQQKPLRRGSATHRWSEALKSSSP
jgi:hypothetical protein